MLTVGFESNLLLFFCSEKHIQVEFSSNLSATMLRCDVSHIFSNLEHDKPVFVCKSRVAPLT